MKYRVIEEKTCIKDGEATSKFFPQRRRLGCWRTYKEYYYGYYVKTVSFPSLELAKLFLKRKHPEQISIIHNVEDPTGECK